MAVEYLQAPCYTLAHIPTHERPRYYTSSHNELRGGNNAGDMYDTQHIWMSHSFKQPCIKENTTIPIPVTLTCHKWSWLKSRQKSSQNHLLCKLDIVIKIITHSKVSSNMCNKSNTFRSKDNFVVFFLRPWPCLYIRL